MKNNMRYFTTMLFFLFEGELVHILLLEKNYNKYLFSFPELSEFTDDIKIPVIPWQLVFVALHGGMKRNKRSLMFFW